MLLFGHAGITLGLAAILATVPPFQSWSGNHDDLSVLSEERVGDGRSVFHRFTVLMRKIDVRFLIIGSLLPDIIDKPLGHLIFTTSLSNGRTYSHTLLFLILISLIGTVIFRRTGKTWGLVLAFGSFVHLVLDQMWLTPSTLLWPLFGVTFEKFDTQNWIPGMVSELTHSPSVYIPEIIGFIIVVLFAWFLFKNRLFMKFLYHPVQ